MKEIDAEVIRTRIREAFEALTDKEREKLIDLSLSSIEADVASAREHLAKNHETGAVAFFEAATETAAAIERLL